MEPTFLPEIATRTALYSAAVLFTPGIVAWAKSVGLPPAWAPLVAAILGELAAFGAVAAFPEPPQHWVITIVTGLGLGMAASGLRSWSRTAGDGVGRV
jgi:hypothetical protein